MMRAMLEAMIGRWRGKGVDVAPTPDGEQRTPFIDEIEFFAVGEVRNAARQCLFVIGYHQVVRRMDDLELFHDQLGYWACDLKSGELLHMLTIPRGLSVVAKGTAKALSDGWRGEVAAQHQAIVQSDFLARHAKTIAFHQLLELREDRLWYRQTTELAIYARTVIHTDEASLQRQP